MLHLKSKPSINTISSRLNRNVQNLFQWNDFRMKKINLAKTIKDEAIDSEIKEMMQKTSVCNRSKEINEKKRPKYQYQNLNDY